jgi:hypothetical protein
VVDSDVPVAGSASTHAVAAPPPARPTAVDVSVTDKAGRGLLVALKGEAFAECLAKAEPGERGYALFTEPLDANDPSSRRVLEEEGLTRPTLGCVAGVLARYRETSFLVRDTFWYVSVGP